VCVDLLSLDIELAELVHVVDHLVAELDSFSGLFKSIFVSVDLTENGTVLQLEFPNDEYLSHSVADALFFKVEHAGGQVVEAVLDALGALL